MATLVNRDMFSVSIMGFHYWVTVTGRLCLHVINTNVDGSLQDEMFRKFNAEWVSNLISRLGLDDTLPIENRTFAKRVCHRAFQCPVLFSFSFSLFL